MKKILNIILLSVLFFNIASSQAVVENALSNISFGNANASLWQTVQSKLYYLYAKIAEVGFGVKTEDLKTETEIKDELEKEKKELDDLKKIVDSKKEEAKKLSDLKSQLQDCSGLSGVALSSCNARNVEIQKQINAGQSQPNNSNVSPELQATQQNTTPMSSDSGFKQGSTVGDTRFNQEIPQELKDQTAYYSQAGVSDFAPAGCGMQKGPMAYAIGGSGGCASSDIKNVFTGYKKQIDNIKNRGAYAGGYINACTEKGDPKPGSIPAGNKCGGSYGESLFTDYRPGTPGAAYIQEQLLWWKNQANKQPSKCIVVDIDNCDSVGWANYKNILNMVQDSNNNPANSKIMVFAKNPQACGNAEAFNHPAVVGAFVEEISKGELQKLFSQRGKNINKPILLAAGSGGGNSNGRLTKLGQNCLDSKNQQNVYASFDTGSEYSCVNKAVTCGQ